jgi:steroid delta-isomerase-like uncharacterized protein
MLTTFRSGAAAFLLLVLAASGCAARDARATNEAVARRVFDDIFNRGQYDAARDIYAADFVNHGRTRDIDLATDQAAAKGWRDAFPDLSMTVVRMVAQDDMVAVLWTAKGTNTGTGNGLPATGKAAQGRGLTLWRMRDGKIIEEWSEFDEADIAKQLGL